MNSVFDEKLRNTKTKYYSMRNNLKPDQIRRIYEGYSESPMRRSKVKGGRSVWGTLEENDIEADSFDRSEE